MELLINKLEIAKSELEDHFILRLPLEEAKFIHKVLRKKPKKIKKYLAISFENNLRYGTVRVNKKIFNSKLVDLPTIIESNKTIDKVQIFKTADVCQLLLCQEGEFARLEQDKENKIIDKALIKKSYQNPHGYAPSMKNVRKFRFRKTLHNKDDLEEAADVEKEVMLLLRMDNEAVSIRFEFIYDEKPVIPEPPPIEITELSIFGETLSDIESDKGSTSTASESNDIMDFTH